MLHTLRSKVLTYNFMCIHNSHPFFYEVVLYFLPCVFLNSFCFLGSKSAAQVRRGGLVILIISWYVFSILCWLKGVLTAPKRRNIAGLGSS